jgi:hypothetical protein
VVLGNRGVVVLDGLGDIDEQGVGNLVLAGPGELGVEGINHGLSQNWGSRSSRVQGTELEWQQLELVASNVPAGIGGWLTAVRTSPAGLAGADQRSAGTTEVARSRAAVALSGHDVVGIELGQ